MELKNLSKHTQRAYLAVVTGLARHYRQSPDDVTQEMVDVTCCILKTTRVLPPTAAVLT